LFGRPDRLGAILDKYPNLYGGHGRANYRKNHADPRFVNKFFTKYQDPALRHDNSPHPGMYRTSFRILETEDEHFYPEYFRKIPLAVLRLRFAG